MCCVFVTVWLTMLVPVAADEKVGALSLTAVLVALPDELLHLVVRQTYYSPLQPRLPVYLSSASRGLRAFTPLGCRVKGVS